MIPFRFRRRSFLAGLGGAVGLRILFENLEASAQGATPPPRFLRIQWPVGTVPYRFIPSGTGTSYVTSPILEPFERAGLRGDMIALSGLSLIGITDMGGGPEGGTVMISTGANSPGTRNNGGEADDSVAGGPSWDQIFLKHVPALSRRDASGGIIGRGHVTASCDARVDSYETSVQCLCYAYETRQVDGARPTGPLTEHVPMMPELDPARLYASVFSGVMPGGTNEAVLKALRMRKSVLDSALRELARIHDYAPSAERPKIDIHTDAIRQIERQLSEQIATGPNGACPATPLMVPSYPVDGRNAQQGFYYGNPRAEADESATHADIGKWHLAVIRAAFQCDLLRVATFQWAPGCNDVAFAGIASDMQIYRHHPLSHRIGSSAFYSSPPPEAAPLDLLVYEFMTDVNKWYNQKTAEALIEFRSALDVFGGNLLDYTIVPYITETGDASHQRSNMAAVLFGGRALGMLGGQYQRLQAVPYNSLWATVAQAFFQTDNPLATPELSGEVFVKTNVAPIPGLWVPT
jgi:hypothetical protein